MVGTQCEAGAELQRHFMKIYGDNANSKLSDERFAMMSKRCGGELTALKAEPRSCKRKSELLFYKHRPL